MCLLEPQDAEQTGGTVGGDGQNSSWEIQKPAGKDQQSIAGGEAQRAQRRPCQLSGFSGSSSAKYYYYFYYYYFYNRSNKRGSLKVRSMNLDSCCPEKHTSFMNISDAYFIIRKCILWILSDGLLHAFAK